MNNTGAVSAKLAARVVHAARELGYHPNQTARGLRLGQSQVWAVVISDIRTGPFFAEVVRGVEDVAYGAGYAMFLCNADEDPTKESEYLKLAIAQNVAGVILTPSGPTTELGPLLAANVHVVLVDRDLPGSQVDTVVTDNLSGASRAVEHLLENGYERIACITGPLSSTTGSQRLLGYRNALEQVGRPVDEALIRVGDFRERGGYIAMQELLAQKPKPDAVFVANNRMAAGALQAIEEANVAIPKALGFVGYDDFVWTNLLRTPLTTVSQPAYDLGHEGARLLLSRLAGYSGSPRTVVLPTWLNIRNSSVRARAQAVTMGDVPVRALPSHRRSANRREKTAPAIRSDKRG